MPIAAASPLHRPSPRPVLLLAHGGFVMRNLLLGTFAERVMLERPLLAAVRDPHDPELVRRFAGRPIRFLAERLGDFGHSLVGEKAAWLLEKTGSLLRRLRLLGALETWYLKRALAFTAGSHSAPLVATGGITLAENPEAALAAVLAYLADPALHRQGRQAIVNLATATPNGGAGERLAIEALALAERSF